jgi:hypothetical protein
VVIGTRLKGGDIYKVMSIEGSYTSGTGIKKVYKGEKMKKKLFLIVSLLVIAIAVILPAAVFADEPAKNYNESATTSTVTPGGPVYLYPVFYGLDNIFTYRVKAHNGSYIGVSTLDCCIPGDWWRANITVYSGSTPKISGTTCCYVDLTWSAEVIVPDQDSQDTMQALLTVTCGNNIPGSTDPGYSWPAGMTVKITSDASSIDVIPVPSI